MALGPAGYPGWVRRRSNRWRLGRTVDAINDRDIAHFVGFQAPIGKAGADRFWEDEVSKKHGESAYFFAIWGYLLFVYSAGGFQVTGYQGISTGWYFAALLARFLTVGLLAAYVVRDILDPERDVARALGTDDPAGGVLDHAEDRFRLRFNPRGRGLSVDRGSASRTGREDAASAS